MTSPTIASTYASEPARKPRASNWRLALVLLSVPVTVAACTTAGPQTVTPDPSGTAAGTKPVASASPWPAPSPSAFPAVSGAAMQKEMDRWVQADLLPGVTAAVVTPQGVWTGAAGVDGSGAALTPASGMALGGISVTFTAAQVMLLAERGTVALDAPASTYLPVPQLANGVTIRQLLAQRAAIPDPGSDPYDSAFTDLAGSLVTPGIPGPS